ncbi:hypothetical protein C2845_PM18G10080 [Panicum miliaceum]|uniref:Uncharacterized protein n=1 Tax=Panicum miliaceum TaxID=4540 RepID=A0A3L6PKU6_PANMI|nr:hypothetical protein C2845_PM18G10080 [Panicum miliaceum]
MRRQWAAASPCGDRHRRSRLISIKDWSLRLVMVRSLSSLCPCLARRLAMASISPPELSRIASTSMRRNHRLDTSTWTGARLLNHKQCLEAAIKEQQQIMKKYGGHTDYNTLLDMSTLHRCLKEALRMCMTQGRFGPGREEDRAGGKFSYTASSGGRHACPGEACAYMQVKVIWSHLLRNFELKLVSSFPARDRLVGGCPRAYRGSDGELQEADAS